MYSLRRCFVPVEVKNRGKQIVNQVAIMGKKKGETNKSKDDGDDSFSKAGKPKA